MADVVDVLTRQKVMTELVTAEGCNPIQIHRCLKTMHGEDAIDISSDPGSVVLRTVKRPLLIGPAAGSGDGDERRG